MGSSLFVVRSMRAQQLPFSVSCAQSEGSRATAAQYACMLLSTQAAAANLTTVLCFPAFLQAHSALLGS